MKKSALSDFSTFDLDPYPIDQAGEAFHQPAATIAPGLSM